MLNILLSELEELYTVSWNYSYWTLLDSKQVNSTKEWKYMIVNSSPFQQKNGYK